MLRSPASRRLAPAAVASLVGALVAAVLLAVSLAGGASATGTRSTTSMSAAHGSAQGSAPARAHVGGHLGGKHARVSSVSSVADHLKDQHLDLTAVPPASSASDVTLADDVVLGPSDVATTRAVPLADSRGPPAA